MRSAFALLCCCVPLVGCATASPMLAPGRVLRDGKVVVDVGSAYSAPVWSPALTDAQASGDTDAVLRAAVTHGATPPGVMSYVAGRGGFGHGAEGSLALIGRSARLGVRREFYSSAGTTFTAGVAGRFALNAGPYQSAASSLTVDRSQLYGGELTAVLGYSRRDIYDLWLGLRGAYLYNDAGLSVTTPGTTAPATYSLGAHRLEVGLTAGMRIAFGRFGAAVELETVFAYGAGTLTGATSTSTQQAAALSLVPAGALSYQF